MTTIQWHKHDYNGQEIQEGDILRSGFTFATYQVDVVGENNLDVTMLTYRSYVPLQVSGPDGMHYASQVIDKPVQSIQVSKIWNTHMHTIEQRKEVK